MIEKATASTESSFHRYSTTENEHGICTPDVENYPLRAPASAHLPHTHRTKPTQNQALTPSSSPRRLQDPEKQSSDHHSARLHPLDTTSHPQRTSYTDDDDNDNDDDGDYEDEEDGPKRHAVWILVGFVSRILQHAVYQ